MSQFGFGAFSEAPFSALAGVPATVVSVTGVATTSSVGSVNVNTTANVDVTGVDASTALGSVTVNTSVNELATGIQIDGEVGTVNIIGDALFSVTGVNGTLQLGSVIVQGAAVTSATGFVLTGFIGAVSITTTNFDYEAVKDLYERRRTVYVGAREQRITYITAQPRVVYISSDRTTSSEQRRAYADT